MKKKIFLISIINTLLLVNAVFATAVGVEVNQNGGPGFNNEIGQNEAIVEYKQYDLNEKFVHTMSNGCVIECPVNVNTNDGMVTTKNYSVKQNTYDGLWYLYFDYTGLRQKSTKFYIKTTNASGLMIDLKEVYVGYESEYNERNGKIKYKAVTEECFYKIPQSAAHVEVLGILESY